MHSARYHSFIHPLTHPTFFGATAVFQAVQDKMNQIRCQSSRRAHSHGVKAYLQQKAITTVKMEHRMLWEHRTKELE